MVGEKDELDKEKVAKEIKEEKEDIEKPGDERSDQFRAQEEMKEADFKPEDKEDNPL